MPINPIHKTRLFAYGFAILCLLGFGGLVYGLFYGKNDVYAKGDCTITNTTVNKKCYANKCSYTGWITITYYGTEAILTNDIQVFDTHGATDAEKKINDKYALNSIISCYYPKNSDMPLRTKAYYTNGDVMALWVSIISFCVGGIFVAMFIYVLWEIFREYVPKQQDGHVRM